MDLDGSCSECNFEHQTLCLLEETDKDRKGFFTLENNFQGLKKKILPFASVLIT